ncbi:dsDNA nuclease domain-containing protein [Vibrio cholerae]|uniref:dsDNA nuclease domain-containing protein n=1 Tax=Vibrio cholerae TaxID=666 RepID=UPI0006E4F99E|nr:SEC-C metal-binding domain-containing protein [Vibrio cholerae]KQA53227.1 zinc chelation protein SecC [Vibrio cholerae]KQA65305.1 zinc chelation protein SecC [Vibrio cholerae]KQA94952.1 zinc chelation protein SecC [Vibrio cholerae]
MQDVDNIATPSVLDTVQLARIEAVHRGFLYQHLYAVACLLLAPSANVETVSVELDEDIELATSYKRTYVQVKTRSKPIIPSDISDALQRFGEIREEHAAGIRKGQASFIIVANQLAGPILQKAIDDCKLPSDVVFLSPIHTSEQYPELPPAWRSIEEATTWCLSESSKINYSILSPDTLVWKLAGLVQLAATGTSPNKAHSFHTKDLTALFEQLIVQLQDFPAPPENYLPQTKEPCLSSNERIRIICGLSGSGKTAWVSQAALHSAEFCAYYDVGDLPGPSLASALVRELAARFSVNNRYSLQKVLLPGASGFESLRAFDAFLQEQEVNLLLVLDNAHRVPIDNLCEILNATQQMRLLLLCQPNNNIRELEARTSIERESLFGWDIDAVAAAVDNLKGYASAHGYKQLRDYTGGLPLYVQSAAKIAVSDYKGSVDAFCKDIKQQGNTVETAQEIILKRVYEGFEPIVQESIALFSLADAGLKVDEITILLSNTLNISQRASNILVKKMRATGIIEVFGRQTLKVHDAVRTLGLQHLEFIEPEKLNKALRTLKEVLIQSLCETRDTSRLSLLIQVYIHLNDTVTLIDMAGQEMFHEMGISVDILSSLESALNSDSLEPIHKFWALDSLLFSELKEGHYENVSTRFEAMAALLEEHQFGYSERTAYIMKKILFSSEQNDVQEVYRLVEQARPSIPDAKHERIFDYNFAIALWKLKRFKEAEGLCQKVISGYFDVLGISPEDVFGRNSDDLWKIINKPLDVQDDIKHIADAHELYAQIQDAQNKIAPFFRLNAMKFYNMAQAPESMVRVGQDLADEFVARKDYVGAREVMEQFVLPVVKHSGLVSRLVQVRSQYAVILALGGQFESAGEEMKRLSPYFDGLNHEQRLEVEFQSDYIAYLHNKASMAAIMMHIRRVGRNDKCPCGSGMKFKKCHGK